MSRIFLPIAALMLGVCLPLHAKLGEAAPQLIKRFGSSFTIESTPASTIYKFRSTHVSVDAVIFNGVSIWETYYSDKALNRRGEPPTEIVDGVLKTNVPRGKWVRVDPAGFTADDAFQTRDTLFCAVVKFRGPQPEGAIWTITVFDVLSVATLNRSTKPQADTPHAVTSNPTPTYDPRGSTRHGADAFLDEPVGPNPLPTLKPAPTPVADQAGVRIHDAQMSAVLSALVEFCRQSSGMISDKGANFVTYSDQMMSESGQKVRFYETFSLFQDGKDVRVLARAKAAASDQSGHPFEFKLEGKSLEALQSLPARLKAAFESATPMPSPANPNGA